MLSSQTVFNKAAIHLLRQGEKSVDKAKLPRYKYGTKGCAMHPFMEKGYKKSIEGETVKSDSVRGVLAQNGVDVDGDLLLLRSLQVVHDEYDASVWPEQLAGVAETFGLTMVKQKLVIKK